MWSWEEGNLTWREMIDNFRAITDVGFHGLEFTISIPLKRKMDLIDSPFKRKK